MDNTSAHPELHKSCNVLEKEKLCQQSTKKRASAKYKESIHSKFDPVHKKGENSDSYEQ